eukprot:7381507-Prymnesium_polylepis.1
MPDYAQALYMACDEGLFAAVELLLRAGIGPDTPLELMPGVPTTALETACHRGHTEIVRGLLDARADPQCELNQLDQRPRCADLIESERAARRRENEALVGMRMVLDGLATRPELNGSCCTVGGLTSHGSRLSVTVDGVDEPVCVSPVNLRQRRAPVEEHGAGEPHATATEGRTMIALPVTLDGLTSPGLGSPSAAQQECCSPGGSPRRSSPLGSPRGPTVEMLSEEERAQRAIHQ